MFLMSEIAEMRFGSSRSSLLVRDTGISRDTLL
jgi:hypothetical protein